ncbi:MAG: hypothetical protein GXP24_12290 [Planctomycetes bacterium]|nr:hypothetical protein [Planctomycetota bacterium]
MNSDTSTNPPGGPRPLTAATRQRLQKVFEHAQRCTTKQDYEYANQLFSQCVVEDPGNLVYLQEFLANLQKKYGDNQKGSRLAGLKIKNKRSALIKATGKGEWETALQAACAALTLNPWDIATLLALAAAYQELHNDECQLYCLRCALNTDAKNIEVNRAAGLALQRMGQFDQAIACWQRVQLALPQDEQARQEIARLSVEQTIDKGGYDPALLSGSQEGQPVPEVSVAQLSKDAEPVDDRPPEVRLQAAISDDPTLAENYVHLADIYLHEQRFDEAEKLLDQGFSACGSGDLQIRTRLEDVQLRRVTHQLAVAEKRCEHDSGEEAKQLAHRFRIQANQVELETYAARAERDPKNSRLKYELGLRLKRAGKVKEAISALQGARTDSKRGMDVLVELGECFQHIEQYKLALSHYEQAIEALSGLNESESEIYRKALYRAGVLATGMQEIDRAERHLSTLAALDFGYRDVADRLDKIAKLRDSG